MKSTKSLKKIILVLSLIFITIGGAYIYITHDDSNAAVPTSFTQTQYIYFDNDQRIPADKQYQIVITTYDHPSRLMNESYIQVYSPNGALVKSQYFNGNAK